MTSNQWWRGSRFGNAMIVVAGADRSELDDRSADRSYYIGLGMSLLLAATISSVSLTEATSIAFHVKISSTPLIVAGLVYFVLLLGVDRWLVSDQTTGFATEATGTISVPVAWVRHFIVELLKIAPRFFVALLSSWLFANFLLLAIFNPEIQQQLKAIQLQQQAQYQQKVDAQAQTIISHAQAIIGQAQTAEQQVQNSYNNDQKVIQAAYRTEQKDLVKAQSQGLACSEQPQYVVKTNPNTGLSYSVISGYTEVCPPQLQTIIDTYQAEVSKYPETQAQVDAEKSNIAQKYGISTQQQIIAVATKTANRQMQSYKPQKADGLLARMHALGLLTTKPSQPCPAVPTTADMANNVACTSQYSPDAATLHVALRLWLLAFEILPIVLKFINALLPRRGYAWAMAARDEAKRRNASANIGAVRIRERTKLARFARQEHVRMEEEGAIEEYNLRELARQESKLGIRRIRARFAAALAGAEPIAALKARRDREARAAVVQGTVIPYDDPLDSRNSQADPGYRIIESEDFLL